MRITLAHEWLTNWAGSERVAAAICGSVEVDEIVAGIVDADLASKRFPGVPVRALWPNRLPNATSSWTRYAPALMAAWASTRIDSDVLLVSSHFAAHAAARHFYGPSLVYYHSPARIIWRPDIELARLPDGARPLARAVLPALRAWDRSVAQHPTRLLANSHAVRDRIEQAYGRVASVVHPPVDVERWHGVRRAPSRHLLWFGRFVRYKRPDLAVEVARVTGRRLVMVGDGPERAALARVAPDNVSFLGHADGETLERAVAEADLLLFPGEEDFGIAPVEVLAAGVPVVAYAAGGVTDYVRPGLNGVLAADQSVAALAQAVETALSTRWDAEVVRQSVAQFSAQSFSVRMRDELDAVLADAGSQR